MDLKPHRVVLEDSVTLRTHGRPFLFPTLPLSVLRLYSDFTGTYSSCNSFHGLVRNPAQTCVSAGAVRGAPSVRPRQYPYQTICRGEGWESLPKGLSKGDTGPVGPKYEVWDSDSGWTGGGVEEPVNGRHTERDQTGGC